MLKNFRLTHVFILLLLLLTGLEYGALTLCRPKTYGLYGAYYDNTEWHGDPFTTSIDTVISTDTLKNQREKLLRNRYSVKWTGYIHIPETETYTFFTNSDDGSWLFIDDTLVVDNGGAHGLREAQGKIRLTKGLHTVAIRYFQIGGYAILDVLRAKAQYPKTPLTADLLLPSNINIARLRIYQISKKVYPFLIALWCLLIIGIKGKHITDDIRLTIIKMSKRFRQLHRMLPISLIGGVLIFTFVYSMRLGLHQHVHQDIHDKMISIALSDMKYGLKGYVGYTKILNILLGIGYSENSNIINNAIQEALDLDNVASDGLHANNNEVGSPIYYKLAFKIFGYKMESLFYLHFLLLAISICVFLVTFSNRNGLLHILLLFVCSHFVIVMVTLVVGSELQVSLHRFTPVLAILPSFYLALLILGEQKINILTFPGAIMQTGILILSLLRRSSATYQLMFLIGVGLLAFVRYWKKGKGRSKIKYVFKNIQLWPLGIVVPVFFLVKLYIMTQSHYVYAIMSPHHTFWCAALVGLSAHPESESKYGFIDKDEVCYNAVQQRAFELGLIYDSTWDKQQFLWVNRITNNDNKKVLPFTFLFDALIRDEFFKMLKRDPWFVLMSYVYKVPLFFKAYFSSSGVEYYYFGATIYLFKWYILIIIVLGTLSIRKHRRRNRRKWFLYLSIIVLQFVCALLPSIFFLPHSYAIADSALLFTLIIYLLFSTAFYYISRLIWKESKYSGKMNS